jgi:hypothetical protein
VVIATRHPPISTRPVQGSVGPPPVRGPSLRAGTLDQSSLAPRRRNSPGWKSRSCRGADVAANVDDIGATTSTPWRVMSWEPRQETVPHLVDGEVTAIRSDLEDALATLDKLRAQLVEAIHKLN